MSGRRLVPLLLASALASGCAVARLELPSIARAVEQSRARPRHPDAPLRVLQERLHVELGAGFYVEERYRLMRIERASGLDRARFDVFDAPELSVRLVDLEARTLLDDGREVVPVGPEDLVVQPVERSEYGAWRRTTVLFPRAQVGALLEVRTKLRVEGTTTQFSFAFRADAPVDELTTELLAAPELVLAGTARNAKMETLGVNHFRWRTLALPGTVDDHEAPPPGELSPTVHLAVVKFPGAQRLRTWNDFADRLRDDVRRAYDHVPDALRIARPEGGLDAEVRAVAQALVDRFGGRVSQLGEVDLVDADTLARSTSASANTRAALAAAIFEAWGREVSMLWVPAPGAQDPDPQVPRLLGPHALLLRISDGDAQQLFDAGCPTCGLGQVQGTLVGRTAVRIAWDARAFGFEVMPNDAARPSERLVAIEVQLRADGPPEVRGRCERRGVAVDRLGASIEPGRAWRTYETELAREHCASSLDAARLELVATATPARGGPLKLGLALSALRAGAVSRADETILTTVEDLLGALTLPETSTRTVPWHVVEPRRVELHAQIRAPAGWRFVHAPSSTQHDEPGLRYRLRSDARDALLILHERVAIDAGRWAAADRRPARWREAIDRVRTTPIRLERQP